MIPHETPRMGSRPDAPLRGETPADRILRVLDTARALIKSDGFEAIFPGPVHDLANALEALDAVMLEEAREAGQEESGHWHPATWADVRDGNRIRLGGQHEATAVTVIPLRWVGRSASQVQVVLDKRPEPYTFPPSGSIEIWTPSLPEWAARAAAPLTEEKAR